MKFTSLLLCATALTTTTNAVSIPASAKALSIRSVDSVSASLNPLFGNTLEKRKGGGGKSGGGGSSSGGGSGGGGRSSGPTTQTNSNAGGRTATGSGVTPNYGGGKYYGGGATAPYSAGGRSPRGLAPIALIPLAGLAIFPGLWLYSAYAYPYSAPYSFRNSSANANQTKPVQCYCQQYSVCGCDDNTDQAYMDGVIGNGSYQGLNRTLANVADVNGTSTILINGTLPNGTTASGGTDSAAPSLRIAELGGWWVAGAVVLYSVMLL